MWKPVALMFVAMSFIPMGDTAGKLLVAQNSVAPIYVAWTRFVVGAVLVLPFIPAGTWPLLKDWRVWFRALLLTGGITSILTALQTEPIANVFGAFFIGPILSFFLSSWLLREPITRTQTLLLFLGFTGVLLVVKPGFGMTTGLAFAVLAGCFYGAFLTASKWLAQTARPRSLLFTQLAISAVVTLPFGLQALPPISAEIAALTFASGLCSMLGNLLLIVAYRMAPSTKLAPFVYFQLIAATSLGWLVFQDLPDTLTFVGLALLIGSGFASLIRKRTYPQFP
nr:DMT family transporter [Cognatishimia sp. MH4019]